MKILYIITSGDIGGAQKYVLDLAKHFQGIIATGTESNYLLDSAKREQIPTIPLRFMKRAINPFYDLLAFVELLFIIKNSKADIIHSNSTKAGILASIAGKFCGKKTIFTVHGLSLMETNSDFFKKIYILAEKFASMFRDRIITVSNNDARLLAQYRITKLNKIATIINGISLINFKTKQISRKELKIHEFKTIVGTIARLQHLKGVDILVRSFSLLPEDVKSNSILVIIGDGPDLKKLNNLIFELKLQDKVMLLGGKKNASIYLKAFDIFVLPSRYEGLPFGLIEAMQAGLPIVATQVGGVTELLENSGLLVEPNSPELLSKSINTFMQNIELRKNMGLKAYLASQQHTNNAMLKETKQIYFELINFLKSDEGEDS